MLFCGEPLPHYVISELELVFKNLENEFQIYLVSSLVIRNLNYKINIKLIDFKLYQP